MQGVADLADGEVRGVEHGLGLDEDALADDAAGAFAGDGPDLAGEILRTDAAAAGVQNLWRSSMKSRYSSLALPLAFSPEGNSSLMRPAKEEVDICRKPLTTSPLNRCSVNRYIPFTALYSRI